MFLSEFAEFSVGVDFLLLALDEGQVSLFFNNLRGTPGFTSTARTVATYNDGLMHSVSAEFSQTQLRFVVDEEIYTISMYDSGMIAHCTSPFSILFTNYCFLNGDHNFSCPNLIHLSSLFRYYHMDLNWAPSECVGGRNPIVTNTPSGSD